MSNIIQLEARSTQSPEELIEEAKKIAGVTQRELADLISASRDQIYRWKKGMVDMPDTHRNKLIALVGQKSSPEARRPSSGAKSDKPEGDRPKSPKAAVWEKFYGTYKSENHDLEVLPFLEMAFKFGFKFPGHIDQAGRATQSQVEQVIKEHGKSFEILSTWISNFIDIADPSDPVRAAKETLKSKLFRLAMAKMDLSQIFKQTVDKDAFSVQAYAVTMEVENDIKELLKCYLESGGIIYRNFFRLTSATNESLEAECRSFDEKSGDVTQYYSLAERTILREIKSIKSLLSR